MTAAKEDKKFAQVMQKIDPHGKLLRTWELKGGVSARMTVLEIERPDGQTQKMIFRQHGEVDLKFNPHIAADEFKLLQQLQSAGLVTPTPYLLDQSCEIFSTPYMVIAYIEGKTEFAPSNLPDLVLQFTTQLSRIHKVDCSKLDLSFLPAQEKIYARKLRERPAKVDESLDEGHIRDTLETVWPITQQNTSVLLHGDFWPGNILWQDGRLVAVIDWENAASGDPLADVANSRLEILWAFGINAMQSFTDQYQAMTTIDFTNLPYWDLCAALRPAFKIAEWAANDIKEKTMREGHRWFITQAFEKLSVQGSKEGNMSSSVTQTTSKTPDSVLQNAAIEVYNLVKHYPKAPVNAVDDISFTVQRGEIFGLLGPNGAGKTTTIGVLITSVIPTSGTARVMGVNVAADAMTVKQRIAVVPQQSNLDQSLRAREILTFHASYHGMPRAEREARADELLNELGLGDRGKDIIRRYSGGMAQRLMLARALMHSPDVLFLDEPTNSLDPQSRLFLWDRIRSLKEQGVTILLTTHDMDEAEQLCERIAIMDKGHILVLNTPEELKKIVPGGTRLEVRVRELEPVAAKAASTASTTSTSGTGGQAESRLLKALRAIPGANKVEAVPVPEGEEGEQDIQGFRIYAEDANEMILGATQAVTQSGAELRDLRVARPSLEDVFIYLTGRNLR